MAGTTDYTINYDDERFKTVENEKAEAINKSNQTYDNIINNADQFYDEQIKATQDWEQKQTQLQQEQTDFAIEKIEQEKDKSHKDYVKEQSGAYVDWQKQSNPYGAEAEKRAASGLNNSGYSESSQVSMYNTYQNRVATARETYQYAVVNYNNMIKEAQLQNNAKLAEIAYNSLQQQLQLGLEGFQYKNNLILEKATAEREIDNTYYSRWQNVLNQMNTENALAEDIRQFDTGLEFQASENEKDRKFQAEQAVLERKHEAEQAELNRKHDIAMQNAKTKAEKELLAQQHKNDLAKLAKQQEYEMAQLDKKYQNEKNLIAYENSQKNSAKISDSSSGSKSSSKSSTKISSSKSTSKVATSSNKTSSSSVKVDISNILSLGYGPISASKLNQLVEEGKVIEYEQNGVIKFKKASIGYKDIKDNKYNKIK